MYSNILIFAVLALIVSIDARNTADEGVGKQVPLRTILNMEVENGKPDEVVVSTPFSPFVKMGSEALVQCRHTDPSNLCYETETAGKTTKTTIKIPGINEQIKLTLVDKILPKIYLNITPKAGISKEEKAVVAEIPRISKPSSATSMLISSTLLAIPLFVY